LARLCTQKVVSADDVVLAATGRSVGSGEAEEPLRKEATRLMALLHKYARENLLVANIYIKEKC
jgi:hypothetical protein